MPALFGLLALVAVLAVVATPLLALLAFLRVGRLQRDLERLRERLDAAEDAALDAARAARQASARLAAAGARASADPGVEALPESGQLRAPRPAAADMPAVGSQPARAEPLEPARPAATQRDTPVAPAGDVTGAAPKVSDIGLGAPPPAATPTLPAAAAHTPPAPPAEQKPAVAAAPDARNIPGGARSAGPPPVRRPPPSRTPAPPSPPFDWEGLLGLRGAAWLGGIALAVAGLLFAKLALDRGLITPELRIGLLLLSGVGALLGAEFSLRRGYATTANAVCGAGIAVLYAAFFAGHALYRLFPLGVAFAGMALVTVVAGALAVRYDALFTALLGLVGGFATPVMLSTGQDRPVGLFSYILLLDVGLLAVALRKGWRSLALLSLAGTFFIQLGWFGRHLTPAKLGVCLGFFLLFGLLYLLLPRGSETDAETFSTTRLLGGLAPLCFAPLIALRSSFAGDWPLLFGFVALLDVALVAVALRRPEPVLATAGAAATALTLAAWSFNSRHSETLWGPTLAAVALVLGLNLTGRLAGRWGVGHARGDSARALFELAGCAAGFGLGVFTLGLLTLEPLPGAPLFLLLFATLGALSAERTRPSARLPVVAALAAPLLVCLTFAWLLRSAPAANLALHLPVPVLAAALGVALAVRRQPPETSESPGIDDAAGAALTGAALLAGLTACLMLARLGGQPGPLFAGFALGLVLLLTAVLRSGWSWLLPLLPMAGALYAGLWQVLYYPGADLGPALVFQLVAVAGFAALPRLLPAAWLAPRRARLGPWLAAAVAGPAFFLPLHDAFTRGVGSAWIGALPLGLAAATLLGLQAVLARFTVEPGAAPELRARRLDLLALFAAVALGFVTLAVPLQLSRQWITVSWALEAAAVWWLLQRLPHRALRYVGALLFAAVGARLLLNWDNVLVYEPRGRPVFNWLLYTYGVPALACLAGAAVLRRADTRHPAVASPRWFGPAVSFLGLLLMFALLNLEIADYFSAGRYVEFDWQRRYARDLTMSLAWGVYAVGLLVVGVWRRARALRLAGLGFLVLTVLKVFLFDLSTLGGIYRVLSVLGLGIALVLVSLLYQRFVVRPEER